MRFMMGVMPPVIGLMVLMLTRPSEAQRIVGSNSIRNGKGTLILSVGNFGATLNVPPAVGPMPMPGGKAPMMPPPQLGGTGQDSIYLLYSRQIQGDEAKLMGRSFEGERMTMAVYRTQGKGPAAGETHLATVRDISYDARLIASDQETGKAIAEMKKKYEEAVK